MTPITPIAGYRELTEEEIDLANEIKALGLQIRDMVDKVNSRSDTDRRWSAIATTDLQTGLMALIRSVLRPEGF